MTGNNERWSARLGEVVESASHGYTAQCYQLYQAPPLGALVKTASPETYGVVSGVTTGPLHSGRLTVARGENEASEEGVYRANPQLEQLLSTHFTVTIVGHIDGQRTRYGLPPLPPRLHAFVHRCSSNDIREFTSQMHFLRLLLNRHSETADEVVSACILQASTAHQEPSDYLLQAGKALAGQLAGDLARLNSLLRSIAP